MSPEVCPEEEGNSIEILVLELSGSLLQKLMTGCRSGESQPLI
jgi:hypothetical protein